MAIDPHALTLPLVIIAGLVDGLNPCAFAVLLLFITFTMGMLQMQANYRYGLMKVGSIYISGIFVTYVLIGVGFLSAISFFSTTHAVGKAAAFISMILGVVIMKDYFMPPEATRVEPLIPFFPMPGGALTANTQMLRDNNLMDKYPQMIAAMGEAVKKGGFGTSVTPVSQFYFQQAFNNVMFGPWQRIAEGYGKMVLIDHLSGFYTLYGNLSDIYVQPGAQVVNNQVIGTLGSTMDGPVLHFEVRKGGKPVDPLEWLSKRR